MGILDYLLEVSPNPQAVADSPVKGLIGELEHLTVHQAKYVMLFAHLLGYVANIDRDINEQETEAMVEIVDDFSNVSRDLSLLIVQVAKWNNILFGKHENKALVSNFKKISDADQREGVIHCLLAVADADSPVSDVEFSEIIKIANDLGVDDDHFKKICEEYRLH